MNILTIIAIALAAYQNHSPLVLAIPRGGVEVGYYVAKYLMEK